MHIGRSRNDQVVTDFKLWIKSANKQIDIHLDKLIKSTIKISEKYKNNYARFTHLKNAQPVSFAHYLLSYVEMFMRDKKRFNNNLDNLNQNPLGVAALTGTSFNIDRNFTTKN